ncbi:hypothetical protein CN374_29210 [Bacillus cereus]|nr:hypothetical protein CN374_29210 [Bacillus cereus]
MSFYTTMHLSYGDEKVLTYYQDAKSIWIDVWNSPTSRSAEELAIVITNLERRFINKFGGQDLGKEIMVQSGFAAIYKEYPNGEDKRRFRRLKEAFRLSGCSLEVVERVEESASVFSMV